MLATHLTRFLKNIFELLERKNVAFEKHDENIMSYFVGFVVSGFKNIVGTVDAMQLSEAFRTSIVKDLLAIRGDILKLISHLSPEGKSADSQHELDIYNLKKKPFIAKSSASDLFTNNLLAIQLGDYYWNSEDFVSFNVVQESGAPLAYFEKPVSKNEDLEKIRNITNHTKYSKAETASNHTAGSISNVSSVETSKKDIGKVVITEKSLPNESILALSVPDTCSENLTIEKSLPNVSIGPVSAPDTCSENLTTGKSLPNESIGALSVPDTCSENLTSMKSGNSEDQSRHCTVNHISVRIVNTLDNLDEKDSSHSTRYISILHLNDLAVINTSFAIDKMGFNSIIEEGTQYICLLCSVFTAATVEALNDHLQAPLHMDKLAEQLIWVTSLETCVNTVGNNIYQCSICSDTGNITEMNKHFKSKAHKQSLRSATTACSSVLEAMENTVGNKETNAKMLTSNFEMVLHQHKIKLLGKQLSCYNCSGIEIPMSLHNLYTHITGQQHWCSYFPHIKKRFMNMPNIRSRNDKTYKGFINVYDSKDKCFCQICKIFIDGVSIKLMNSHIMSYGHNTFLMLFLKNGKISAFIDLNEAAQEEDDKLSLPGPSRDKLEANTSKGELKTNTSQKTKINESTVVQDAGSHVIFNYNFAIDKYSLNAIKRHQNRYKCELCGVVVPALDRLMHIARDSHKLRMERCPLNFKDLTIKMENNVSFCVVCCDRIQEESITDHSITEHHKARMDQHILVCENWKMEMNCSFAKVFFPIFPKVFHNILVDILKQNQLIVVNFYLCDAFCNLCSAHLLLKNITTLYEHMTGTGHFSAFVESMNINWVTSEPNYVNGVMTSAEDNEISFCLVCNFILPSDSVAVHLNSGVHEYLSPIFIDNAFRHHLLSHIHDTVVCLICDKKLSEKSLNFINIFDHITGSVHKNRHENILKKGFCDASGEVGKMSLDLSKSGIQRFQRYNLSYCSSCNILLSDGSDWSILGHMNSRLHYIFEHVVPKQLKKKK